MLAFSEIGPGNSARAAVYQLLLRSGILRRMTPRGSWKQYGLEHILRPGIPAEGEGYGLFKQSHCTILQAAARRTSIDGLLKPYASAILESADAILKGSYPAFGMASCAADYPPDWHSPLQIGEFGKGGAVPAGLHWTQYPLDSLTTDVKLIWELSRFGWLYPLVRAFRVSGERVYLQRGLDLIRDWQRHNPPNTGPQWISAQEVALRILAMGFLIQGAGQELAPIDWETIAVMMAAHAHRIPATRLYARAQDNNHLLVEAAGLFTAGMLFPGLKHARDWESLGRRELESGFLRQVFPDGGYVQHSHTYARVALQTGLWSVFIGRELGRPLSSDVENALRRLALGLFQMVEKDNGKVPNYGPNDGALIRPLSVASYRDFRPAIQGASLMLDGERMFPPGPWEEEAYWLGWRPEATTSTPDVRTDVNVSLPAAGLHRLQGEKGWAVLRCGPFRNRPGHSDQLHIDLWRDGVNVLCDPGTYQYNANAPWENPFTGSAFHNTAWIAGREPMLHAGRFLWLNWDQGTLIGRWATRTGRLEAVCGVHGSISRGLRHRRTLARLGEAGWLIVDDFLGEGSPELCLAWNLRGKEWERKGEEVRSSDSHSHLSLRVEDKLARLTVFSGGKVVYGEAHRGEARTFGWYSPTYAVKQSCVHLVYSLCRPLPFRLVTWVKFTEDMAKQTRLEWRKVEAGVSSLQALEYAGERLELTDAYLAHSSSIRRAG